MSTEAACLAEGSSGTVLSRWCTMERGTFVSGGSRRSPSSTCSLVRSLSYYLFIFGGCPLGEQQLTAVMALLLLRLLLMELAVMVMRMVVVIERGGRRRA